MERLGLGPDVALKQNPRLVYGRMTGWGQTGPLAQAAGHDLNYLALIGALAAIGRKGSKPTPPLNLAADFGGGALYLAFGVACAMIEAQRSGKGQVVDAAMTDGAASLMTMFYGLYAAGYAHSRAGDQPARLRIGDLRNVRMRGRPLHFDRADRAEVSRSAVRTARRCPTPTTTAPSCATSLKSFSRPAPATNGARCWKAPTRASRRFSRWRKRRIIRITSRAARCRDRRRRAADAAPRFSRTPAGRPTPPASAREGTRSAPRRVGHSARKDRGAVCGRAFWRRAKRQAEIVARRISALNATSRRRGSCSPRRARCAAAVA